MTTTIVSVKPMSEDKCQVLLYVQEKAANGEFHCFKADIVFSLEAQNVNYTA